MDPIFRGFFTVDLFDCPPFQMFTSGDDPVASSILATKSFEPHSMRLWCRYAREASSIFDIGAHTGIYSLAAAALRRDIPIHAFEPNPFAAARLRLHKHLNGFNNIVEYPVGLSERGGIAELIWQYRPDGQISSGGSLNQPYPGYEKAITYTATLDSLEIPTGDKPLLKIDVEGTEVNVFKGMEDTLKKRPLILVESFQQPKCDAITAMLPGYRFALIQENGELKMSDRLVARDHQSGDFNQLCIPEWMQIL
jgi:FkbM family methyltransferase